MSPAPMERISIAPGIEFSRIVYGMWRLCDDDTTPAHVQAKVEACLAAGITTLDQADIYGDYGAEAVLGAAFKAAPHLRDRVEIVTKCDIVAPAGRNARARVKHYDTSRPYIETAIDTSLGDMGIECIDLLLIHRPDPLMDHRETGEALDAAVAAGKVRAVGVSNFRPWDFTLLQSAMETPLVVNQIELSLAAIESFTNGDLAFLQERDIRPMAWSPLGGGALLGDGAAAPALAEMAAAKGCTPDALAVAWLLRHPARILPVMGTNRLERIARLGEAFDVTLDREDWYLLYTAALGREVA